ncbi:MAG: DNA gyrase inhibitor YacG [bacterium]|nr:DNA gyrase inhibitor YacG [bacterium]
MKCPICRKQVALSGPCMPVCSERCKLLDRGNWASEKYVISTPVEPEVDSEEPPREGS